MMTHPSIVMASSPYRPICAAYLPFPSVLFPYATEEFQDEIIRKNTLPATVG